MTTQNTLIKWKSDFWTYTTWPVGRAGLAHVRSFACRGRLRNLLADCCTLGLFCVTITRQ